MRDGRTLRIQQDTAPGAGSHVGRRTAAMSRAAGRRKASAAVLALAARVAVCSLILLALLLTASAWSQCLPDPLGAVGPYTIVALGDLTMDHSSSSGRMAAGGELTLQNFTVGDGVPQPADPIAIVVAGAAVTFTDGTVSHGDLVYGTTADLSGVSIPDGVARQGAPIDFDTVATVLTDLGAALATLEPNGTTEIPPWHTITLTGTDPQLNVFALPGAELSQTSSLTIEVPAGSTALINVDGAAVTMQNFGFSLDGATRERTLFNLYQATNLTISSVGVQGTVLAPAAAAQFSNGSLAGALIAATVSGNGSSTYAPFVGCLEPPADGDSPTITDLSPAPGGFYPSPYAVITASFADAGSGVDPATAALLFDGTDVTAAAVVSAEGIAWGSTETVAEGVHSVEIQVADLAGNLVTQEWSFTIDATPPTLTVVEPPGTVTGNPTPAILVSYGDALSGIDPPSLQIVIDGADITATCAVTATEASCTAPQVTHDFHTLAALVSDVAGHTVSATHTFQVLLDLEAPTISITSPADGEITAAATVEVTGTVTDDGEIARSTVQGEEVTLTDGAFAHEVTLQEGANGILVAALDATGKTASATLNVIRDVAPPSLQIEAPKPDALVNAASVTVRGRVSDDFALAELAVDGAPVEPVHGLFESVVALTPGPNAISISATDTAGNTTQETLEVEYFTLPQVTITAPEDLSTIAATTTEVSGTVGDTATAVTVNGAHASLTGTSFTATGIPLIEGGNTLTATVTDAQGHVATSTVTVRRDTQAPRIAVYNPEDGSIVFTGTITVHGLVNEIVAGTVNSSDATVTVNGLAAQVANRSFLVEGVSLTMGQNLLEVVTTDASGNMRTSTITVTRSVPSEARIELVSGGGQSGVIGTALPQPLVARVVDALGTPVPGVTVVFAVEGSNGSLQPGDGGEGVRKLAVETDTAGEAAALFTLGTHAGVATQVVEARAAGYEGEAEFVASALPGEPELIVVDDNGLQVGIPGRALPRPLVVAVVDAGSNRLAGVPVRFRVTKGGGHFPGGASEIVVTTDTDGRSIANFILGPEEGIANHAVAATIDGLADSPVAGFVASALAAGDPAATIISGVVLDNANLPVPGVTARIRGTALTAVADAEGHFTISGAPVGAVDLIIDGSTTTRPGAWPDLEYDLVTIPGRENTVGTPIYLLPLDLEHSLFVSETEGGTITLPNLPGFALEVPAGSVTFPGGGKSGLVSVTVVHSDKVPMTPNFGQQPRLIITIQPAGALFDPPARLTFPNVNCLAPGEVTEMYSFDHDLGKFVSIGPATTSDNATVVVSNPGVGILKAGWHSDGPPTDTSNPHDCGDCESPSGSGCVPDDSQIPEQEEGNCRQETCEGGSPASEPDDSDVPENLDPHDCQKRECVDGHPHFATDTSEEPEQTEGNCYREKCPQGARDPDPTDPPPGLACCIDDDPLFDDVAPYDPVDQCCTPSGVKPKYPISLFDLLAENCPDIRRREGFDWPSPDPPNQYDGCTVHAILQAALEQIPFYSGNKNNPAGFDDTSFAFPAPNTPCFLHDACYYECVPDRLAHLSCNAEFGANLFQVCATADPAHQPHCWVFASIYFDAVSIAAPYVYKESQQAACQCC